MGTPTLVTRAALNQNGSIFHSWIQVHWVALMVIGTGRRLPRIAALALGEHSLFAVAFCERVKPGVGKQRTFSPSWMWFADGEQFRGSGIIAVALSPFGRDRRHLPPIISSSRLQRTKTIEIDGSIARRDRMSYTELVVFHSPSFWGSCLQATHRFGIALCKIGLTSGTKQTGLFPPGSHNAPCAAKRKTSA